MKVKFSIIIPCYNRSEMISDTVESVLNQDYTNFELILVDDGSTDNTLQILQNLSENDKRIRVIEQVNSERGAARNNGWKNAIGEWVCFLDSDDLMLPNHLSTLSSAIECHKEINLFATYYDFLEGGKIQASPMKRYKEERYAYPLLLTGNPFACNITIRNFSPETIPFREERNLSSMEDWIFLFSNMWAQDLFLIGKCTIHMREHELRSMRNHDLITTRRMQALDYILTHFSLTRQEKKLLKGYSNYFCGIHYYLDQKRFKALRSLLYSMKHLGVKKEILKLLIKIIIGRKTTLRIKDVLYPEAT
ncbi:MAG TPA: glycosyltransferase family 2 protein [Flavobacteriales bacterium]|nr:hypothetical protein [Flavobacterium sp.]HRE73110.1 glycosyltransferase family 2 protein [Flavobacteriales bacterium]HRJ39602.1 glycosyltransferase family 2 protein [Flavobacteriales bacterium]